MSPTRLDELRARRSDFRGGVPLRLADGALWYFPRPALRLAATDVHDPVCWTIEGRPDTEIMARCLDGLPELTGDAAADEAGLCVAMGELGVELLRLNYDLPVTRAAWLVADGFRAAGESLAAMALAVEIHDVLVRPLLADVARARRQLMSPWRDGGGPAVGWN